MLSACRTRAYLSVQDTKPQAPRQPLPAVRYQEVHTTFVRGTVDPAYFGLEKDKKVPSSVLLTESAADLAFSSLALKNWVGDPSDGVGLYKLFSRYFVLLPWVTGGCGPQMRVPIRNDWLADRALVCTRPCAAYCRSFVRMAWTCLAANAM